MRRVIAAVLTAGLMLVGAASTATANPNRAPAPGPDSIAEVVVASTQAEPAEFTLLLAALEYTGLTPVFTGGGQYTVFAPTDAAFLNLVAFLDANYEDFDGANPNPFEAIDDLLGEGTVADVLLYHVTEGRRAANSVVPPRNPRTITTLLGATFSVDRTGTITDTFGQQVGIVAPNVSARNGVVHVIDTVLLPLG